MKKFKLYSVAFTLVLFASAEVMADASNTQSADASASQEAGAVPAPAPSFTPTRMSLAPIVATPRTANPKPATHSGSGSFSLMGQTRKDQTSDQKSTLTQGAGAEIAGHTIVSEPGLLGALDGKFNLQTTQTREYNSERTTDLVGTGAFHADVGVATGISQGDGCGFYLEPAGVEFKMSVAGNIRDHVVGSYLVGAGVSCLKDRGNLAVILAPVYKFTRGGTQYGDTHGTAAGARVIVSGKDLLIRMEGTMTATGQEEGGQKQELTLEAAAKVLGPLQISGAASAGMITDRVRGKSGEDTSANPADIKFVQISGGVGGAW
jgi:hypothetical protein